MCAVRGTLPTPHTPSLDAKGDHTPLIVDDLSEHGERIFTKIYELN